jgi:hypothetical protein
VIHFDACFRDMIRSDDEDDDVLEEDDECGDDGLADMSTSSATSSVTGHSAVV